MRRTLALTDPEVSGGHPAEHRLDLAQRVLGEDRLLGRAYRGVGPSRP
jgi:hypothetical protein